jgi:DNA end-binding protein Ku
MAPRAYWKGYLKLSLVSCPIALYPASSSSERVSFHRINKKTGNRLKQQLVDAETGDVVDKEAIGRGYEIGKGPYLSVEDNELEKIKIQSTHTIEIGSFELLRAKQEGRVIEPPEEPAPHRVINLMDALRASIGAEARKKPAAASTRRRGAARRKMRS